MSDPELKVMARLDLFEARLEKKIVERELDLLRWVVGVGILQSSLLSALLLKMISG